MEKVLQSQHCRFRWTNHTSKGQRLELHTYQSMKQMWVRTTQSSQFQVPSRHSQHMEMVLLQQHIGFLIHPRCRVERWVLRSSQSMRRLMVDRSGIVELVHSRSSTERWEMVRNQHCRCEWIIHTSRDQRLGFRSTVPKQQERVRIIRRCGWIVHSMNTECMEMVLELQHILEMKVLASRE
jgi:hypothetical protein